MGNTMDSPSSPYVFFPTSLALIEELKPDCERGFRELNDLIECLIEEPVNFDRVKIVVSNCNQAFKRIKSSTKRHWQELQTSTKQQADDYCKKSLLKTDQKWGFVLLKRLTEVIKELTPQVNKSIKWMTEISNKLQVTLIMHTILEDRARDLGLSWWWKLIPFGSTLASNITKSELARLALERIQIQALFDKNEDDMNNLKAPLDEFIANRELIESKIINSAEELEAQPRNEPEMNSSAELVDLILGEILQFLDINHCVLVLDGQMDLGYVHNYSSWAKPDKKDLSSRIQYLLKFISNAQYYPWIQVLVSPQLLDQVHQKALRLNDLKMDTGRDYPSGLEATSSKRPKTLDNEQHFCKKLRKN